MYCVDFLCERVGVVVTVVTNVAVDGGRTFQQMLTKHVAC